MKERIIGIMGAMPEEINGIIELLADRKEVTRGMRTYYTGNINQIRTVVVFSRWGKVAAATTVSNLILEFGITELIFTGVAGAIDPSLNIGDIVVANRLIQHDMDARPIMPRFEIPLLGVTYFESAGRLADISVAAVNELIESALLQNTNISTELKHFGIARPKAVTGTIASGDKFFSASDEKIQLIEKLPDILCVEMEGAATAQVCYEYDIPFTIIRTISDAADDNSHVDFQSFIQHISSKYSVEIIKNIYKGL